MSEQHRYISKHYDPRLGDFVLKETTEALKGEHAEYSVPTTASRKRKRTTLDRGMRVNNRSRRQQAQFRQPTENAALRRVVWSSE